MITIRKPTPKDEESILDFRAEMLLEDPVSGNRLIPGGNGLEDDIPYEEWLNRLEEAVHWDGSNGLVQALQFIAFDSEERAVGVIQLRTELNDYLRKVGGHIGYAIRPSDRKKGYASEMLQQCIEVAKNHGIKKLLLTCNDTNIGSIKTIEKAGGIFDDTAVDESGVLKRRYWIDIT